MELPEHLQNLNPSQMEAVRHGEGPLLIFAGAGSGKTRVLTRRIANLIIEYGAAPNEIFAVTFTNKAAQEMKERVSQLLHRGIRDMWVSTFHSSCARILRRHAGLLGFKDNFAIYDTADSTALMKRVFVRQKVDPKIIELRSVMSRIDRAKNNYEFSDSVRNDRYLPEVLATTMADLFDGYQDGLLEANAMDFGDLLCHTVSLFKLEPRLLERYQEEFRFLLIDEYQDTNRVQYLLVQMLAKGHKNLCVVGDDDQSIYAFRGASVENILNFRRDFPGAKVITLDMNYRSTKYILGAANNVIEKNKRREKKTMRTDNSHGSKIIVYEGFDERDEGEFIIRELGALLKQGVPHKEIAIFYRTNSQSRAIEEALCEVGIPYEIYGSHKFYDRKEIKDILAYLRLLLNESDNEALLRIINVPARGIGASSVSGLVVYANQQKLPIFAALRKALLESAPFLTSANKKKFGAFVDLYDALHTELKSTESKLSLENKNVTQSERVSALPELLTSIATQSGYLGELRKEDTAEAESRIENIHELFEVAGEFAHRLVVADMPVQIVDFLERTSLSSDLDKEESATTEGKKRGSNTVSLMTLHLAKGLEFNVVFLAGMEEGLLPHVRSLDDREALEEERRLCYVGITRARRQLYLTRAEHRQTFGRGMNYFSGEPSRFLFDIPEEFFESKSSLLYGGR